MSIGDGGLSAPVEEAADEVEAAAAVEGVLGWAGVEEDTEEEEGYDEEGGNGDGEEEEEKEGDVGGEWVLPPLPKLEKLCLAR